MDHLDWWSYYLSKKKKKKGSVVGSRPIQGVLNISQIGSKLIQNRLGRANSFILDWFFLLFFSSYGHVGSLIAILDCPYYVVLNQFFALPYARSKMLFWIHSQCLYK